MLPCNYKEIFKDRLLILTGVGRSGTTIAAKLLASMTPAYMVFEPALFKYIDPEEGFYGVLFEDYFLPIVQGRGNWNPDDWSSMRNQLSFGEILHRWKHVRRRTDAMELIAGENPLWIVKSLEIQRRLQYFEAQTLEIVRNGYEVVESAVARGWFTDEWCNHQMIEWAYGVEGGIRRPFYAWDAKDWAEWNPWTRAAHAWGKLCLHEMTEHLRYEFIAAEPEATVTMFANRYGLKPTELTEQFIQEVKHHKRASVGQFDLNLISEPERKRFVEKNTELGYNVK